MREYVGLNESGMNIDTLPSVAMSFDGYYIENLLEGYRTLKVSGRETLSNILDVTDTHIGGMTHGVRLPSRTLTITYKLEEKDNKLFQDRFKQLRRLLTTDEEVPVKFADDEETTFFGRLASMESVPDDRNNIISTFTIHCDSPYKYGDLITTTGVVTIDTFYPTLPELITLDVSSTTNNIAITNGTHTISATGTFNAGAEVVFYFEQDEMRMTVNGVESTYMIDLQSDLENFYLEQGQTLRSNQGSLSVAMREVNL